MDATTMEAATPSQGTMTHIAVDALTTRKPFDGLFRMNQENLVKITESMRDSGFDEAYPLIVWGDVVVSGHTRLKAAQIAEIDVVPIQQRDFADDEAAIIYAMTEQTVRRNLTDDELLKAVRTLDKLKTRGRKKETGSSGPVSKGRSADATAKALGMSASGVKRVRAVLTDPTVAEAVEAGELSINQGAEQVRAKKRAPKATPVAETVPPSMTPATPAEEAQIDAPTMLVPMEPIRLAEIISQYLSLDQIETLQGLLADHVGTRRLLGTKLADTGEAIEEAQTDAA